MELKDPVKVTGDVLLAIELSIKAGKGALMSAMDLPLLSDYGGVLDRIAKHTDASLILLRSVRLGVTGVEVQIEEEDLCQE